MIRLLVTLMFLTSCHAQDWRKVTIVDVSGNPVQGVSAVPGSKFGKGSKQSTQNGTLFVSSGAFYFIKSGYKLKTVESGDEKAVYTIEREDRPRDVAEKEDAQVIKQFMEKYLIKPGDGE